MKNIVFFFAFVFASLFFVQRSDAQCYVRLEDASGINTDGYQDSLQAAAAKLCAIFDTMGFAGQFKVYDFGFYLHQENTTGGYPEPFEQKIAEVQALSPYYLLFGKQTDKTGVYTKFWVDLVLPDTAQFSCMTELQREVYGKRVEKKTTDKYAEKNNNYDAYNEAEIAGIDELYKTLNEISECCLYRNSNRMAGCDECSDELSKEYFDLNNFKSINLNVINSNFVNIRTELIRDYSFHKFVKSNQNYFFLNYLSSVVAELNNLYSLNLLITSNQSLCIDSLSEENLQPFKEAKDFFCHINLPSGQGLIFSRINITWNAKPGSCIQDPDIAKRIIDNIYCRIYQELGNLEEGCSNYQGGNPPWKIEFKSGWPSGGLNISDFIELIKNEEEKYTEAEQKDTKTMITRFRKLFYGSPGWDDNLIKGVTSIKCIKPYEIISSENSRKTIPVPPSTIPGVPNYSFEMVDIGYYPIDPTNNNERPDINLTTNSSPQTQEVRLEFGTHANMIIDIGHTLCGMDAYNNQNSVGVGSISMNRNLDAVTWLGDLGSALAEIRVKSFMEKRGLYPIEIQDLINHYASPADNLGDVDGLVIPICYLNSSNQNLKRVSEILSHYYLGDGVSQFQEKRYTLFSQNIGLIWDPVQDKFSNRELWKKNWVDQTTDAAALYIGAGGLSDGIPNVICAVTTIFAASITNGLAEDLLETFVKSLEELRNLEP